MARRQALFRRLRVPVCCLVWGVVTVATRLSGHHLPSKGPGHASPAVETIMACIAAGVTVGAIAYLVFLVRNSD